MNDRRFTVDEANRLLPVLLIEFGRLAALRQQAGVLARQLGGMDHALADLKAGRAPQGLDEQAAQFAICTAEFQRGIERINAMGCLVKDVETGVVDFPSELEGQPVLLCWQLGEPVVSFFHQLEEDETNRTALPGVTQEPMRLH